MRGGGKVPEQFPICTAYLNCADNEKRALRITPRTVGSICAKISGTNKDEATAVVYPVKVEGSMQGAELSKFLSILYLNRGVLWVSSASAYLFVMSRDILLQYTLLNKELLLYKASQTPSIFLYFLSSSHSSLIIYRVFLLHSLTAPSSANLFVMAIKNLLFTYEL